MRLPTIHINGTSKAELNRQVEEAAHALDAAITKLSEAYPNGRDYYPQGAGVIQEAAAEHRSRMERLRTVRTELQTIWEHITDAGTV